MVGTAYGVGVGPGDPELLTLKALRVIRACDVVAAPGEDPTSSRAYQIAAAYIPELGEKELLALPAPMVRDRAVVEDAQRANALRVEKALDAGKDVAVLVLGDPAIYSSFSYLQHVLVEDGYRVETVSGVPSFCAAAARLGVSLVEWDEPLHVVPLAHADPNGDFPGTQVLMKPGHRMGELRELAHAAGLDLQVVENCGLPDERIYRHTDDVPDQTGYLSVALLRQAGTGR